jgi:hypothetical protein
MFRALLIVTLLAGAARADGAFDVLTKPGAKWTYDVYKGKKKTGEQAVLTLTSPRTSGAYTAYDVTVTGGPEYFGMAVVIIGPDGLRSLMSTMDPGDDLKGEYENAYMPYGFVPAKLEKKKWKANLDRFGQDDREYKLKAEIKAKGSVWTITFKGKYTIPENGETEKFESELGWDPAIGFTQICVEKPDCLKLSASPSP